MSHATLVNDGLWVLMIVSAVLLVTFISAVAGMPPELARPAEGPAPGLGQRTAPLPQEGPPVPLPRRHVDDGAGYVARHASPRSGPPWGPAPKPPGVDR